MAPAEKRSGLFRTGLPDSVDIRDRAGDCWFCRTVLGSSPPLGIVLRQLLACQNALACASANARSCFQRFGTTNPTCPGTLGGFRTENARWPGSGNCAERGVHQCGERYKQGRPRESVFLYRPESTPLAAECANRRISRQTGLL